MAALSIPYNVLRGLGEIATELDTVATVVDQHGRPHQDGFATPDKLGSRARKGMARFLSATLRSPMNITLALADGAHYMPRHWRDLTLRKREEITGVRSGVIVGCKVGHAAGPRTVPSAQYERQQCSLTTT